MKPKRLEFCGINSFSRRAVIDFDKLLSGGVFGIFGDTGSGKTTILDSMIFALYGRVDRVKDGSTADLINYSCEKAVVVCDFETVYNGGRRVYRVEREIKRRNELKSLRLSEWKDGKEFALSEGVKNTNAMIEEIVGLSFDEFKKCIALPQGEFAQFLKETKGERLKLISHLFGLEKYGVRLNETLKERFAQAKSAYDVKAGELKGYEELEDGASAKMRSELEMLYRRKEELDKEYEVFRRKFAELETQYNRYTELSKLREEAHDLEESAAAVAELRSLLKRIPAAREVVFADQRCKFRATQVVQAKQDAEAAAEKQQKAAAAMEALKSSFDAARNRQERDALTAKEAMLDRLQDDARSLRSDRAEWKKRLAEQAAADKICKEARSVVAARSRQAEMLAVGPQDAEYGSFEELLRHDLDSALLSNEYRRNYAYFQKMQAELHRDFTDGELFRRVDAELTEQIGQYAELLNAKKSGDVQALFERFKEEQRLRSERIAAYNKALKELSDARTALAEAEGNAARCADSCSILEERIKRQEKLLQETLGTQETDLENYAEKLSLQRKALEQEERAYAERLEALTRTASAAELAAGKAEAMRLQCERESDEEKERFASLLRDRGFADGQEASAVLAAVPDPDQAEQKIAAYEEKVHSVKAGIAKLTAGGEPPPVAQEDVLTCKQELDALTERKQAVAESAAVFESRLADLEQREKQKKRLEKELAACGKELDLVAKLRELLRGNGLMEFVAGEYLSDISASATKMLLTLTNGRYFIKYNQGFFVGDNLCGGELRGVSTLSGGETFLVSLSLALALSAAIYARSLKPIEFFFLDEGFGTLDEKLIDTVMDSLEKLKDSHFSVGLISHVDELRHRIENKILVYGAAENGSSVIKGID